MVFPVRRGNYLEIIRILMRAGCEKPQAYRILRKYLNSSQITSRHIVDIANNFSANPLVDALYCGWNQSEIQSLVKAVLEVEGESRLISLLKTQSERGLTPLQEARDCRKFFQQALCQKLTVNRKNAVERSLLHAAETAIYLAQLEKEYIK
jgi:hypothetical protein